MRSALLEIDDSAPYHQAEKVLKGLSFGTIGFKDKFRFYYGKGPSKSHPTWWPLSYAYYFYIQLNTGTQAVPNWITVLQIEEATGQVIFGEGGADASLGGWYY